MLVYLAKGHLPWMGIQGANKQQKYEAILKMKQELAFKDVS